MIKVNNFGNGIFCFDDILDASQEDVHHLISNLEKNVAPEGYSIDDSGRVLNSGGYEHHQHGQDIAPFRYVNTMFDGISEKDIKTIESLEKAIYDAVVIYCKYFPTAMTSIRWKTRGYMIKYTPGRSMGPHSDASIPYKNDQYTPLNQQPICNTLTCTITLNQEFTGGDTGFRPWGISVPGKAGRVLIYPANFIGCHEIYEVKNGTRYAYLSWYCHGDVPMASPNIPTSKDDLTNSVLKSASYIDFDKFKSDVNVNYQQLVSIGELSPFPERERR